MRFRIAALLLLAIVAMPLASADLGPKPTADIKFTYDGRGIPALYADEKGAFVARMTSCDEKEPNYSEENQKLKELKYTASVLGLALPNEFFLSEYDQGKKCYWGMAWFAWVRDDFSTSARHFNYFIPEDFKLVVFVPKLDKVFVSNEVHRKSFNASFEADLKADGSIAVKDTTPPVSVQQIPAFIISAVLTIIIEMGLALLLLVLKKIDTRILLAIFLANLVSIPIVWFALPLINADKILVVSISEIFAAAFESLAIWLPNQATVSLKKAVLISLGLNAASFFAGGIILAFVATLFGLPI